MLASSQFGRAGRWFVDAILLGVAGFVLSESVLGFEVKFGSVLGAYRDSIEHWNGEYWTSLPDTHDVLFLLCASFAILGWSWVCGFALGSLSGRRIWLTALAFHFNVVNSYRIWLFMQGILFLHKGDHSVIHFLFNGTRLLPFGIAVPLLFLIPLIWGIVRGLQLFRLGMPRILGAATALGILTSLLTWMSRWYGVSRAWGAPAWSWQTAVLSLPVLYVMATQAPAWQRANLDQ